MKVVRTFHITPNHLTFYAILSFVLSNTKLYFYWRKQLTTNILTIYYEQQLSLFSILGAYFNPGVLNTIIVIDSLLTAYDATLTLIIIILHIFSHINFHEFTQLCFDISHFKKGILQFHLILHTKKSNFDLLLIHAYINYEGGGAKKMCFYSLFPSAEVIQLEVLMNF